jgi:16S rRNA (adenine(1408)-N(1))-methyltransferase
VIVDLGTGDGRSVLARAAEWPAGLVIGIDANAAGMAESSRRAVRGNGTGRVPNALFLVEAAEALPGPLDGVASLVTVTMPWGSLLRGVLGLDDTVLHGIASIVAPSGSIRVLVSVKPEDAVEGLGSLDGESESAVAAAWSPVGFELVSMRPATIEELRRTRSSWVRRLGSRPVWRIELTKTRTPPAARVPGHSG